LPRPPINCRLHQSIATSTNQLPPPPINCHLHQSIAASTNQLPPPPINCRGHQSIAAAMQCGSPNADAIQVLDGVKLCLFAEIMSRPQGDEALRSFMHQLGMLDGIFGHSASRDNFAKIAEKLQPSVPAHEKITALNEISESFTMGTELTLRGFNSSTFAPLIVPCLHTSSGSAVVNAALSALFNIIETIPQHMAAFVHGGCVRPVVAVLENLEFIDIAEQAVSVLSRLAPEYALDIAGCNGLTAVLTFIDFFDAATQRSLASIAAQLGKAVAASSPSSRAQFLPQFLQVLPALSSMMSSSMIQLHTAGHQCTATLLMCINDDSSSESLQSLVGGGALTHLFHSLAAYFYVAASSSEPRDRLPSGGSASASSSPAEVASSRQDSFSASVAGCSTRLSDTLALSVLLALQHFASFKVGQRLLLENSIESLLSDFFLGHGFSLGASQCRLSSLSACALFCVFYCDADVLPSSFAPSVINQRLSSHTLSICRLLAHLLPPLDVNC
jgi:hypothetical protein